MRLGACLYSQYSYTFKFGFDEGLPGGAELYCAAQNRLCRVRVQEAKLQPTVAQDSRAVCVGVETRRIQQQRLQGRRSETTHQVRLRRFQQ